MSASEEREGKGGEGREGKGGEGRGGEVLGRAHRAFEVRGQVLVLKLGVGDNWVHIVNIPIHTE